MLTPYKLETEIPFHVLQIPTYKGQCMTLAFMCQFNDLPKNYHPNFLRRKMLIHLLDHCDAIFVSSLLHILHTGIRRRYAMVERRLIPVCTFSPL
jgi:hypothetical protein